MATENVPQLPFHPGAGLNLPNGATIGEQLQSKGVPIPAVQAPPKPNIQSIIADPKFQALNPTAQAQVLSHIDPNFAGLSPEAQGQVLSHLAPPKQQEKEPGQSAESKEFFLGLPGTGAGATASTAAATLLGKMIPSAARAGAALSEVKAAAGKVPIQMGKAGDTALELYTQSQRGASLPKVVRDFVTRATKPGSEPITYAEAKDFQSNVSSLSAEERMTTKPNTLRLIGQLNSDLKESLQNAADVKGKGEVFAKAMEEYRHAMQLRGATEKTIKALLGVAGVAGGTALAKKVWDAMGP